MYPGPGISSSTSRITAQLLADAPAVRVADLRIGGHALLPYPFAPAASLIPAAGFGTRSMYTLRTAACRFSIRRQRFPGLPNAPPLGGFPDLVQNPSRDSPTVAGPRCTPTGPTKKWACAHSSVRPASERNQSIFPLHGKSKDKGPLTPSARNSNPTLTRTARKNARPDRRVLAIFGLMPFPALTVTASRRGFAAGGLVAAGFAAAGLACAPAPALTGVRLVVEAHDFLASRRPVAKNDDRRILRRIIQEEDVAVSPRA